MRKKKVMVFEDDARLFASEAKLLGKTQAELFREKLELKKELEKEVRQYGGFKFGL